MKQYDNATTLIEMIENGIVICPEEILEHYNLTEDELDILVREGQIAFPDEKYCTN